MKYIANNKIFVVDIHYLFVCEVTLNGFASFVSHSSHSSKVTNLVTERTDHRTTHLLNII